MNKRAHDTKAGSDAGTPSNKPRGAQSSGTSGVQLFKAWWHHHGISCVDSLRRLLRTPLQSLLTWMVIAIAIALPAALYLGLKNVQQLGRGWQDSAQMSVFLQRKARDTAIDRLYQSLQKDSAIATVERISPGSALAEFQRHSGLGDVLNNLEENPLPTVLIIQPSASINNPEKLSLLQQRIQANPIVDNVQLDMGWLQRLHELLALGQRIVFALGSLLALGVLLIIGNTMRLAIENRRDEIVVTKMVGGTNGFVRRPFLYTGFWYGLGGGVLALLLIAVMGYWLSKPVDRLVNLYESTHSLMGFSVAMMSLLLLLSILLGWLGAWLAVARHLKQIEPK